AVRAWPAGAVLAPRREAVAARVEPGHAAALPRRADEVVGLAVLVGIARAADRESEVAVRDRAGEVGAHGAVLAGQHPDPPGADGHARLERRADDQIGIAIAVHVARAGDRVTEVGAHRPRGEGMDRVAGLAGEHVRHTRRAGGAVVGRAHDHVRVTILID